MKRIIAAFFLLLVAFPAHAGWNLRQNDDGTTSWVRDDATGAHQALDVGQHYLTVTLSDVATASTTRVAIPITGVRLSLVQSVVGNTITTTDTKITFWKYSSVGVVQGGEITNGTARMTIAAESITDTTDSFTPSDASGAYFEQGQVLVIESDGGGAGHPSGAVPTTFTITLVPR